MSNTGKGIQTKACQLSMGQYCGNFTAENLAYNNNSNDEAQKLRWVYLLRNKRVIISNEITNNKPLNGNLIKKISSGGDSLQARVHGGLETDFIPQFLTIVLANDIPEIKPYDDAVQNRVRVYSYTKSFVDEPANEFELRKDPNLEKEMETKQFQRCFIGLLVQSYLTFQQNGRVENEPQEVMVAKTNWMGSNEDNNIMNKFQQQFEITNSPEDYVFSKDIETWITSTKEMSYMKFVMELKKYCIIEKYDDVINKFKKVNKVNYKSWFGIKKISQQQEEEREEEESIEGCIFEEI
jgi:phage/plasmid-associated DNA primase